MNAYKKKILALYRGYASRLAGDKAQLMTRAEQIESAALRCLKSVSDCGSDEDAVRLFEGARLLGVSGQDKEGLDSILALWELVKPGSNMNNSKMSEAERAQVERDFTYHAPTGDQPDRYTKLRDKAKELAFLLYELCPPCRERSLALTNLEQAGFWANASIARSKP